jgi:pyrroloquinoline-quinone synthase
VQPISNLTCLVDKIDEEIRSKSLLKHPFYEMWSRGELSGDDLRGYSKEYFQLVKLVPHLVQNVLALAPKSEISNQIRHSLKEEEEHIGLWKRFAVSLGVSAEELDSHPAYPETIEALKALDSTTRSSFIAGVAAMYAYELEIPKISSTKIKGLKQFYGLDSLDSRAYFEAHEEADVRHAGIWKSILVDYEDEGQALNAASKSLNAQNQLLTSVMKNQMKVG